MNISQIQSPMTMSPYVNADWAFDLDDRKSTYAHCVYFEGNLISWGSKKQSIISRSSTEAEYRCLALIATELIWFDSLFSDLHITLSNPLTLWCDNLSAIHLRVNPFFTPKQSMWNLISNLFVILSSTKNFIIQHLPASAQIADILTLFEISASNSMFVIPLPLTYGVLIRKLTKAYGPFFVLSHYLFMLGFGLFDEYSTREIISVVNAIIQYVWM